MLKRYKILKLYCSACTACASVCPKRCISFKKDNQGFEIPVINTEKCISCDLCEKVCSALHPELGRKVKECLILRTKNSSVIKESSSGGIFYFIAKDIIHHQGVVFGAKFNKEMEVIHDYAESIEDIKDFMGSKYVQSHIGDSFKQVKQFLIDGRRVLFSGTPCQIAGLKKYLKKDYNNLITIDFICHGVPSPLVLKKYLRWRKATFIRKEGIQSIKIENFSFREKSFGWKRFSMFFKYSYKDITGKQHTEHTSTPLDEDVYMKGFLADLYLRPSCYHCKTKCFTSNSDITLADAWGIWNITNRFSDDKGASLVIIHSEKGNNAIQLISDYMEEPFPVEEDFIHTNNPAAYYSAKPHKNRKLFYKLLERDISFDEIIYQCLPPPNFLEKIVWSIQHRITVLCKRLKFS